MIDRQYVIVTDLDGTLLDHDNYSFAPAKPLLEELAEKCIPVVLCTSKTRSEVEQLREQLNNSDPFIIENGAAIYVPKQIFEQCPEGCSSLDQYWVKEFCPPRNRWLELLKQVPGTFAPCVENFANMSDQRVVELTGLSLASAKLARCREYGEPIHWRGSEQQLAEFTEWAQTNGATILRGGRFVHVAGASDKGRALRWLVELYRNQADDMATFSIALGDSHNDVAMLDSADSAVVVRSPNHGAPALNRDTGVYITRELGPRGWDEGVRYWMAQT